MIDLLLITEKKVFLEQDTIKLNFHINKNRFME